MKGSTLRILGGPALRRVSILFALVLFAAPAFAVTTNVTVAGAPPDQVQSVTLTLPDGVTVQAERDSDNRTGAAVWVVDTAEAIPPGTAVMVAVQLVNGQTAFYARVVDLDGAIAINAGPFYTQSSSQTASASESLTVHTGPGNVVKFLPDLTYPLPGRDLGMRFANDPSLRRFFSATLWGVRPQVALDAGQTANAGTDAAGNLSGGLDLSDTLRFGDAFTYSGFRFRYDLNTDFSGLDQGMTYEQQVADALAAVASPGASCSVAQDSSSACQYGSGVGYSLGYLGNSYGDILGGGPLRLEVNMSEGGQDDGAWTSLGDYLNSPEFNLGGNPFTGGTDRFQGQLNQVLSDRFLEGLQQGHDQDPVQGVADESGTYMPEPNWQLRLGVRYDLGGRGSSGRSTETGTGNEGGATAGASSGSRGNATDYDDERIVVTGSRIPGPSFVDTVPIAVTHSTNLKTPAGSEVPEGLSGFKDRRLRFGTSDFLTFNYGGALAEEVEPQVASAGTAQNNACRDKAPGPFLDWSDPNVEDKYRSDSSRPGPFVLRLP